MTHQPKRWIVHPAAPVSHFARLSHVAPLIVQLLWNRGIDDPTKVDAFLKGETRLDDPFRIKGMNEAVDFTRYFRRGSLPALGGCIA